MRSGRVELLGEVDTRNPNIAVEAVVGKMMLELAAMGAETGDVLMSLVQCELIATDGESLDSASPSRPES